MLQPLAEALEAAPPELEALRSIVRRHAGPVDEWPESGHFVRELADRAARRGASDKAALVLVAALEDLGRYFTVPDEDDDGGWHRSEAKHWEAWAYARALRSVLVDSDTGAAWRTSILAAIASLWRDVPEDALWFTAADLEPLSPADMAALGHERPSVPPAWPPFEVEIADQLLAQPTIVARAVRAILDDRVGALLADDAEQLVERAYALRRVGERLARAPDAATADPLRARAAGWLAIVTVTAIDLQLSSQRDSELAISDARDAVVEEQVAALERLLEPAVRAGGPELRGLVREAAAERGREVAERIARLLGDASDAEVAQDMARLRAEIAAATGDEARSEAEMALVTRFGDHLADDEYLALCRSSGLTQLEVDRLLARGRDAEALSVASAKLGEEQERFSSAFSLRPLAESFLRANRAAMAEQLLRPFAESDPFVAQLFARALCVQQSAEAAQALFVWFAQRPTLPTYIDIAREAPRADWLGLRERMRAYLQKKKLFTTLVDIAIHEEDVDAFEALLPSLADVALEHARARAQPLLPRLSQEAAQRLELGGKRSKKPAKATELPRGASGDAPVPARVSHPKFGIGRVVRAEGNGDQRKYVVAFDAFGEKTLLARFVEPA